VRKIPFQIAVRVMSLFTKLRIRFGNTGAINPRATMSSMTVTKMNGIAAWRFFIAREASTQRCSGGCVNRRWIGWKARPLLRIRYGSEDDVGNRQTRRYQAGKPHSNGLRTKRSTLAILRDDVAFLSVAENGSA
jgi:hypothetical protein